MIRLSRRTLIAAALTFPVAARAADNPLAAIERKYRGRLGVTILDTATGRTLSHRANERFAMCSTFKLLAAAAVLKRVDDGREQLDRQISVTKDKIIAYSPAVEKHLGGAMTLATLCEAAVTLSDNGAANLILETLGGPKAVTALARGLGDTTTRLDRNEPALNDVPPGDVRDTTTPAAMARTVRALTLGDALSDASRRQLCDWLIACKTGDKRLRAGLPKDWRVGDKTGTGPRGIANDVAVIWPTGRAPLVVTGYYQGAKSRNDRSANGHRDAVLAEVGRVAAAF
jgi:beta-lactamase class A